MADILIKGMKMPKDCPLCPLSHWNKLDRLTGCELVWRYVPESEVGYWQSSSRPEWCPLVEVEEYQAVVRGQLVDADAIIWADNRPAIIELSEGGD